MLGQRRRRLPNGKTTLAQPFLFAGMILPPAGQISEGQGQLYLESPQALYLVGKIKRQYLLTCKISSYCLLALHGKYDLKTPWYHRQCWYF